MDIMRPLRVRIDVTHGTATPAQPDPQTIHLNAAQTQNPPPLTPSRALLFQAVDIPAETARLVRCHNSLAQRGRILLPRRRSTHVCFRSACAYQWIRGVGRDPQPPL